MWVSKKRKQRRLWQHRWCLCRAPLAVSPVGDKLGMAETVSDGSSPAEQAPGDPDLRTSSSSSSNALKKQSGGLLRLFQSECFDSYFHMFYLYKRANQGVHDYLVNLLYRRPDDEIHFYLPQLW
eukprot:Gregarina_sp_Pseudo_9__5153@NODE_548_length_2597_cov_19_552776_g518_i0_p7_GENE_NODE_548_length_2597_cov_19_552776_g518_i0NODE_548_length_2597_cov_19_552776_g518_i0_p7_ORF_typecomplete_len124_score13_96PI3Ka/PF00613_20/0_0017_NODE_548_length_2597_cov_19_552776_g518_i013401711